MRIITVCLGNICRSPAAEAVLKRALQRSRLDSRVSVRSAGTADYHVGEQPYPLTLEVGRARGYTFDSVGAQLTREDIDDADLILVMDESNYDDVLALAGPGDAEDKVHLLGEFASSVDTQGVLEVPDPWQRPKPVFVDMYEQIEDCVEGVVAAIKAGDL